MMDAIAIILQVAKYGHLIGLAGYMVCLLFLYGQILQLFLPSAGNWQPAKMSRFAVMVQRFLWLTWLCGISLLLAVSASADHQLAGNVLLADKLLVLTLLAISGLGVRGLVERLIVSVEQGIAVVKDAGAVVLKFCVALSVAAWVTTGWISFSYLGGMYSHRAAMVILILVLSVVFALLLCVNNKWINLRTSRWFVIASKARK